MSRIVVDSQLRRQLNGLNENVELCDESGTTIGHFVPESLYRELLLAWSKANLTEEELERRRKEPRGRTLTEIWQSLGQQ
jgi:hypothetical protein